MSEDSSQPTTSAMAGRRNPPKPLNADGRGTVKHPLHQEVTRNLATLNELVAEMLRGALHGVRPDLEFVNVAEDVLAQHNWSLGYEFQGMRPHPGREHRVIDDEKGSVPDHASTDG